MIINFASLGSSGGGSSSAATYEAAVLCAQTYTDIQVSGISSDVLILSGVTNNLSGVTVGLGSQINEVEEVASIALNDLNDRLDAKLNISDYESATQAISVALNQLNNTKVSSTDIRNIVKMTQVEYDALSGNTEATTLYVITSI